MRIGLVKFIVPFVFAFYPVLLIVEESGAAFSAWAFASIVSRLAVAIYLVSSAAIAFDYLRLPAWEIMLRLALAVAVLLVFPWLHWPAAAVAIVYILWHRYRSVVDRVAATP